MKVLILGGAGYIGSRVYAHLSYHNEVDTVDLEWFGNYTNEHNIQIDFQHLTKEFLGKYGAIILLAGHSSVQMCKGNNVPCFNNNVRNFVNLIPKLNNQIFIYASSSSVYGNINVNMATEDCALFIPDNAYDLSKSEIDNHAKLSDLNYYGLRFGTVNGASTNFRADIMINAMVNNAITQKSITICPPNTHRPILGLKDLCRAIETIITTNKPELRGIYNLASFNASVKDIGTKISDIMGVELISKDGHSNYDFTINCDKFSKNFNFTFNESIETIVDNIYKNWEHMTVTKRANYIPYI